MQVPVIPGSLPIGFCPASLQDMLNAFSAAQSVTVPDALGQIISSATAPAPGNNVSWQKLDTLGRPLGIYYFAQGAWLRLHQVASGLTMWWFANLPDFTTFDGGDGNALSAISGPMWQQAVDGNSNLIQAAFILTPGTLPSGTVAGIGGSGGEEKHILVPGEDVPHQHLMANTDGGGNNALNSGPIFVNQKGNGNGNTDLDYQLYGSATIPTLGSTAAAGGVTPPPVPTGPGVVTPTGYTTQYQAKAHNTMPPYVVGYLLQRTTRLFYIG